MKLRSLAASLLLCMATAPNARAQAMPAAPVMAPAGPVSVTLITFGLGEEVFERFGHNALWFHDARTGEDSAYHWGLFSFDEPGFLVRFLTGDTKYWMGAVDARALIEQERSRGRPTTLQRLNLTPEQAIALLDYVHSNARPENKFYRYDYFRDNCSTRLRDALDHAVGGAIKRATESRETTLSYRSESLRLTEGDAPVQAGIDIALGKPADAPLTVWQSFFIPMRLRDAIREIRIPGPGGVDMPLVASEQEVALPLGVKPIPEAATPPRLVIRYGALGVALAALVMILRIMMVSRRTAAWGLALYGSAWSLMCGVLGVILLLAWMATRHVFWADNETVLLLTPLSLALVVLIPMSVLSARAERATRMTSTIVAAFGLVALLLALIPGGQENGAVVALLLPMHLALAWALALPRAAGAASRASSHPSPAASDDVIHAAP